MRRPLGRRGSSVARRVRRSARVLVLVDHRVLVPVGSAESHRRMPAPHGPPYGGPRTSGTVVLSEKSW